AHLNVIARKTDNSLDQCLLRIAWKLEDDDITALRHTLKQPAIRHRTESERHRVAAIAVRVFGGDDIVADLQCRLHRAGRDVVGAGNSGGGDQDHADADGRFLDPVKHLLHYGFCHVSALGDRSHVYIGAAETNATLDAPPPRLPHAPP